MDFNDNTTKVIVSVASIIVAIAGGALFTIRKSKSKKYANRQSNISMTGDGNKVVGGDDKSTTTFSK